MNSWVKLIQTFHLIDQTHLGPKNKRNMAIDLVLLLTLRLDRKNKLILGLYARISLTKAYWTWRVGQTSVRPFI